MALLFMDSFDHYASADLVEKWTSLTQSSTGTCTISSATGRRASGALRCANGAVQSAGCGAQRSLAPSGVTCVMGVAVLVPSSTVGSQGFPIASFRDGASAQVTLRVNSDFTLSVLRGTQNGTLLGTPTTATITADTFTYVEWKVTIDAAIGTVVVRINGVPALSLTAQNTRNTANTQWTGVGLGAVDVVGNIFVTTSKFVDLDDLYVLDGSSSAPLNDFLGDCRVDPRYPTAEGASSAWTPLSGTDNALMVDETAPDDDTTYNSTSTVGATDTHVVQDAPVVGAILYGVQLCLSAKKSDSGTCSLAPVVRHSGVDYPGTAFNPGTTYAYALTPYGTNPGTGAAWTEAGFNAIELGYTRTA